MCSNRIRSKTARSKGLCLAENVTLELQNIKFIQFMIIVKLKIRQTYEYNVCIKYLLDMKLFENLHPLLVLEYIQSSEQCNL